MTDGQREGRSRHHIAGCRARFRLPIDMRVLWYVAWRAMASYRLVCALILGTITGATACGGSSPTSPSTPTSNGAVVAIEGLTATVEPITSPGTGWLYRLTYRVHETGGKTAATPTATHFALSNGFSADGNFTGPGVLQVPRVPANGTITVESNLSVLTTTAAASHVVFTVTYTDDNGHTGSVSAAADISTVTP